MQYYPSIVVVMPLNRHPQFYAAIVPQSEYINEHKVARFGSLILFRFFSLQGTYYRFYYKPLLSAHNLIHFHKTLLLSPSL